MFSSEVKLVVVESDMASVGIVPLDVKPLVDINPSADVTEGVALLPETDMLVDVETESDV